MTGIDILANDTNHRSTVEHLEVPRDVKGSDRDDETVG